MAQARTLVADMLEDEGGATDMLNIIEYRQRRNHAAYVSHRKRTIRRHQEHRTGARKRKVS